jgi:hypothetical protein
MAIKPLLGAAISRLTEKHLVDVVQATGHDAPDARFLKDGTGFGRRLFVAAKHHGPLVKDQTADDKIALCTAMTTDPSLGVNERSTMTSSPWAMPAEAMEFPETRIRNVEVRSRISNLFRSIPPL